MARQRKSGRFTKSTRRRTNRKPKTNLTNLAVSALVASQITQGMFNTNLVQFLTGNTGDAPFGGDGASVISLPELLGVGNVKFGGNYGPGRTLQSELSRNFKANWAMMALGVVGIPIVAGVISKVIRKPVILPANRMLKSIGLKDVKI